MNEDCLDFRLLDTFPWKRWKKNIFLSGRREKLCTTGFKTHLFRKRFKIFNDDVHAGKCRAPYAREKLSKATSFIKEAHFYSREVRVSRFYMRLPLSSPILSACNVFIRNVCQKYIFGKCIYLINWWTALIRWWSHCVLCVESQVVIRRYWKTSNLAAIALRSTSAALVLYKYWLNFSNFNVCGVSLHVYSITKKMFSIFLLQKCLTKNHQRGIEINPLMPVAWFSLSCWQICFVNISHRNCNSSCIGRKELFSFHRFWPGWLHTQADIQKLIFDKNTVQVALAA